MSGVILAGSAFLLTIFGVSMFSDDWPRDLVLIGAALIGEWFFLETLGEYLSRLSEGEVVAMVVESDDLLWISRPSTDDNLAFTDHEPQLLQELESSLPQGGIFLDVGAHVGRYSVRLARKASKIYSIEPNPTNFQGLLLNIKLNNIENIEPLQIAASSTDEGFRLSNVGGMSRRDDLGTFQVQGRRLDKVIPVVPDLVKIDVEGFEKDVLEGMDNLPATNIIVEVHEFYNSQLHEIEELMRSRGYNMTDLGTYRVSRYVKFTRGGY